MVRDYTARELSVRAGVEVLVQDRICGWMWVTDTDGNEGWIPETCVA